MKKTMFKAVCPLEIGDMVAIKTDRATGEKTAYYMPSGTVVITADAVAICTVTDISMTYYLKNGETVFMYELDESGEYEALSVRVPANGGA